MKYLICLQLFFGIAFQSSAQLLKEWFLQKQTQKEYLITQIAALQVYTEYVEKGYDIARNGLNMIGSIKMGDLDLHTGYFNSLKSISPALKQYSRVADIIRLLVETGSIITKSVKLLRSSGQFTAEDVKYVEGVYTKITDQSTRLINELFQVNTDATLQMKDDERMKRIDRIYSDVQTINEFAQVFGSQLQTLIIQRQKEQDNIQTTRQLFGIK